MDEKKPYLANWLLWILVLIPLLVIAGAVTSGTVQIQVAKNPHVLFHVSFAIKLPDFW